MPGIWRKMAAVRDHRKEIQYVANDMSGAYTRGVSEKFRNIRMVYEKIHVNRNVVEACDQLRNAQKRQVLQGFSEQKDAE